MVNRGKDPIPSAADQVGGTLLVAVGAAVMLFALLGLPLGYSLAESDNLGLLILAIVAISLVGLAMVALGRAVRS